MDLHQMSLHAHQIPSFPGRCGDPGQYVYSSMLLPYPRCIQTGVQINYKSTQTLKCVTAATYLVLVSTPLPSVPHVIY